MPIEEKDLELTLLGIKVARRPNEPSRPGLYWYTTRAGYNMAIFKNTVDVDDPKPYEWSCGIYGGLFSAGGKEASLDEAIQEAHVRLANHLLEVSRTDQAIMSFLIEPTRPSRFERDPVL
jgi:hypothetical protein